MSPTDIGWHGQLPVMHDCPVVSGGVTLHREDCPQVPPHSHAATPTLDDAWREAQSAAGECYPVGLFPSIFAGDEPEHAYVATARGRSTSKYGATPTEALLALASALRNRS